MSFTSNIDLSAKLTEANKRIAALEAALDDTHDLRKSWPELQDAIADLIGHDCACGECEEKLLAVLNAPSTRTSAEEQK